MLENYALILLYFAANYFVILTLWYQENYFVLRKIMLFSVIQAIVFAGGNKFDLGFGLYVSSTFLFLLNYFIMGFILYQKYGDVEYINILKGHFYALLCYTIMFITYYLIISDDVHISEFYFIKYMVQTIFADRMNTITTVIFIYYLGQLLYVHSYKLVEHKTFNFEFLVRLPVLMFVQSIIFYTINYAIKPSPNFIQDIYNTFITGNISRYVLILGLYFPCYYVYMHNKRNNHYASVT